MTNKNKTIADWLGISYCDHDWSGVETIMYGGRDIELSKCIGCGEYEGSVWEYPIDFETDGGFFVLLAGLKAKEHEYSIYSDEVSVWPDADYNQSVTRTTATGVDIKTALIEATLGLIEREAKDGRS